MTTLLQDDDATGKAKELYSEIKDDFGMVPNFFKAQAAVDPEWLELNWRREKKIMVSESAIERKNKEMIALAVSLVNRCGYCSEAHENMAKMAGASEKEIGEVKQIVELFCSFNSIADSLQVPTDS